MILFRQLDTPGLTPGIQWQIELRDDAPDPGPYPLAIAWVSEYPPASMGPVLQFVLVPDNCRRQGFAGKIVAACRERWPNIWLTDPISDEGAALVASIERMTLEPIPCPAS